MSSAGGDPYWILRYDPDFTNTYGVMSGVRSGDGTDDGNLFWTVGGGDTGSDGSIIVKMNKDGDILLDKRINNSSVQTFKPKIEVDSSDNVFFSHSLGGQANLIVKLNSSLVVQSQQKYTAQYNPSQTAMTIYNDDLYLTSNHNDFYPYQRGLGYIVDGATMNVSGTPYGYLGIDSQPKRCVHVDGSGNIYATQPARDSSGADTPCVIKWGTDWSSEVWVRKFTGISNASGAGQDLSVDSSGNVYNCGQLNIAYPNRRDNYVVKFNSSGTVQWMKSLNMPNGDANTYLLANLAIYAIQHTSLGIVTLSYGKSNVQSGKYDINVSLWNTSNGSLISSYGVAAITSDLHQYNQIAEYDTKTLITEKHVYIAAIDANQKNYIMKLPITDASGIYGTYNVGGENIKIAANGFQDTDVSNTTWSSSSFSNTSRTITKTSQSGYGISDVSSTPTLVEI